MKIHLTKASDGSESYADLDKVMAILIPSRFNVDAQATAQVIMQGAALTMGINEAIRLLEAWQARQKELEPESYSGDKPKLLEFVPPNGLLD